MPSAGGLISFGASYLGKESGLSMIVCNAEGLGLNRMSIRVVNVIQGVDSVNDANEAKPSTNLPR